MLIVERTLDRLRHAQRDRGDADPMVVLISLAVMATVIIGITWSTISAQRWSTTYASDSTEQANEDAARLAWLGDVGTATGVVPAAKAGTTAQTSVRFDDATAQAGWPAGATCRATTWWLEDIKADPTTRANSTDQNTGEPIDLVAAHRDMAYYAASNADGTCVITGTPVSRGVTSAPIKNAAPGARFSYVNGHLRDLVYPNPAQPSAESCEGVAQSDTAGLVACTAPSEATIVAQRTAWEWADPEPVQVLLEMTTDQAGAGAGFGTQIGWRETTGRRELVGDATSAVVDTLTNPPAPAAPATAPATTAVLPVADPAQDYVTVRRTDTRDLDGFEYQCRELLRGVYVRTLGPVDMSPANPAGTLTLGDTRPGHSYACSQRGWVTAVTPAVDAGQRFPGGVSLWSAESSATRRPMPVAVGGVLNPNDSSTFTWAAATGAEGYEVSVRVNSEATWTEIGVLPAGTLTWTSGVLPTDTRQYLRVRAVNDGGVSPWAQTSVDHPLDAPTVSIGAGAVGVSSYTATWDLPTGYNAAVHSFRVEYRAKSPDGWSATTQDGASFTLTGVSPAETGSVRVVAVSVNTGEKGSNIATVTRPIMTPSAPSISTGSYAGGVTSTASWVGCEAGTYTDYLARERMSDWNWWQGGSWGYPSTTMSHGIDEGTTVVVQWETRCVATNGTAGPSSGASEAVIYRPYTAPTTPTLYNPADGYPGDNVEFDWSATGGVYQYSGWYDGTTTNSYLTTTRNGSVGGYTCLNVRAAKNAAAAAEGAWSGWSGQQCALTLANPYPTAWGRGVPAGCPALAVYITPTSPSVPFYRRSSTTTCQLRWEVTDYGDAPDSPQGTITGTGTYIIGSGASGYTRTSGTGGVMGPLT